MEESNDALAAQELISYYRLTRKELDAESILSDYRAIYEKISEGDNSLVDSKSNDAL